MTVSYIQPYITTAPMHFMTLTWLKLQTEELLCYPQAIMPGLSLMTQSWQWLYLIPSIFFLYCHKLDFSIVSLLGCHMSETKWPQLMIIIIQLLQKVPRSQKRIVRLMTVRQLFKRTEYFKWCNEHPEEPEKRCRERYPNLQIGEMPPPTPLLRLLTYFPSH